MAVTIRVNADTTRARNDLSKLENSVKSIDKTAKGVTSSLTRLATGIATAFGTAIAIKGINNATNSLVELENRIALVTGRTAQLGKSLDNLYKIARESRGSVEGAAETFNRFGLALAGTGASVSDIEKAVQSVQKSIAISGGSAQSASAAIFQLGQGLASGTLRGQELNSVLEQAPRLARAISDELGVGMGALRGMAEQGLITTDVVFKALLNQAGKLNTEFDILEQTSAQAFVVLNDNLKRLIGNISKTLGFTSLFTDTFNSLTNSIVNAGDAFELSLYAGIARFSDELYKVGVIFGGVSNVAVAFAGRVSNAIRQAILPFRTTSDNIYVGFIKPIFAAERQYRLLGLKFKAISDSFFSTGSQGSIRKLFVSTSAEEARVALDDLARVIDNYGRGWNNFGANFTNLVNPALISLEKIGIGLGLVDQRLIRFRATSMEDFNFILELTSVLLKEVVENLKTLSVIRTVLIYFIQFKQQVSRIFEGVYNDVSKVVNITAKVVEKMFQSVSTTASKYLTKAKDVIVSILTEIERKFFWLYDKVIGNSWWTDTMRMTYDLAKEYLDRTIALVKSFATTVVSLYQSAFSKVKPLISGLLSGVQGISSKISIDVDFRGEVKEFIENPAAYLGSGFKTLFVSIGKPLGAALKDAYKQLREITPFLTNLLVAVFGTKLIGLVSSSFAAGLSTIIKGGILASIGLAILEAFGDSLLDSGAIADFGFSLGAAAGKFVDLVISNIPQIIRAFGQVAIAFGKGIADSLSGIPGIIAQGITSIPLVNIIPGLLTTGLAAYFLGAKGIIDGFIKGRQSSFDSATKVFQKSSRAAGANIVRGAPRISFLESTLIGRGGGRRTLAKYTGLVLVADQLLRTFIGDNAFSDIIVSGGIIGSLLLGTTPGSAILSKLSPIFEGIKSGFKGLTNARPTAPYGLEGLTQENSFSAFADVVSQGAGTVANVFKEKFSLIKLGMLKLVSVFQTSITTIQTVGSLTANAFRTAFVGSFAAIKTKFAILTSFIARNSRKVLIGGVVGALLLWADSGNAATNSVAESTESMFGRIKNAVSSFIMSPIGLVGLTILGSGAASAVIWATTRAILGRVGSLLAGFAASNLVRGGILSLGILGSGSILAGLGTVLASVGATILAFITGLAGLVVAAVGVVGVIGIAIFGDGDTLSERFGNAYDATRKFFGFASRSASKLKSTLSDSLSSFDKIGDIDVNFKPIFEALDFENIGAAESKELQKIAKKTNAVLSNANDIYNREGELSRAEIRRVKRAVDLARLGFTKANVDAGGDTGRLAQLTTPLEKLFTNQIDFRSLNTEIGQALNLKGVSDDLSTSFEDIGTAISDGSSIGIQLALQNLFSDPALVQELNGSEQGKSLLNSLNKILQLAVGGNIDALSPESFSKISDQLVNFGAALSVAESKSGVGALYQQNVLDAGQALTSGLTDSVKEATKAVQTKVKADAEKKFLDIATAFSDLTGNSFDLKGVEQEIARRLSTEDLADATESLQAQFTNYAAALDSLAADNIIDTAARKKALSLRSEAVGTLASSLLKQTGLFDENGEVNKDVISLLGKFNDRLDKVGVKSLNLLPQRNVSGLSVDGRQADTANQKILSALTAIEVLQSQITDNTFKTNKEYNDAVIKLEKQKRLLGLLVDEENALSLSQVDRIGAIESALGKVNNSIKLENALTIDDTTLTKVLEASAKVDLLGASLKRMREYGSAGVDLSIIAALKRQIDEAMQYLSDSLSIKDGKDKNTGDTEFEKFVNRLTGAGFGFDLETAATLSKIAIEKLQAPLKAIEKAQKAITKSTLDDNSARKAAIAAIKKQKEAIFNLLTKGPVGQVAIAFEAVGIDPALAKESEKIQRIGYGIRDLQIEQNLLGNEDLKGKQNITRELIYQQSLIDGLTTGARASSDSIRTAFADSFKSLAKGQTTVDEFFTSLADTLSNTIIDTVVDSFVTAFFQAAGLNSMFDTLFAGLFNSGNDAGKNLGKSIQDGIETSVGGNESGGWISKLFSGGEGALNGIFNSLIGAGGGGGLFSSLFGSSFGSFFNIPGLGLSEGGIVPTTSLSRAGIDSVPAMLTPGELVVPAGKVNSFMDGNKSSSQTIVNLSVTGDISRQTKSEIFKMLPTIANGVNMQNKENNYRG